LQLFILATLSPSFGGTSEVPRLCYSPAMIIDLFGWILII
jgi:hypothetical protein